MFNNEPKVSAVMALFEQRKSPPCQSLLALLDICTQEMREANDHAGEVDFKLNQGEIRAYRKLKGYIERGFPVKSAGLQEKVY